MKWIDITDIALDLLEKHPEVDPLSVRFTDLRNWIMQLPEFDDDAERCNEKILEAVQMAWIKESD
ncbi:MAG: Fe-S assembly protein IscX [Gammaproteobacteria bacterium]|nr:Fe-S assembly protein IscX [Gammaproteobacteria bacterium]